MFKSDQIVLRESVCSAVKCRAVISTGSGLYRVLNISKNTVTMIRMDTGKLSIDTVDSVFIKQKIVDGEYRLFEEEFQVLELSRFSVETQNKYIQARCLIDFIEQTYCGRYEKIPGSLSRPHIREKMEKLGFSGYQGRRIVRQYLQSGMSDLSLIDGKALRSYGDQPYVFTRMPGNFSHNRSCNGCLLTEQDLKNFEKAANCLKGAGGNKKLTINQAYKDMVAEHYTTSVQENGGLTIALKEKRPSFDQFYYYVQHHVSKYERTAARKGEKYMMNNCRLYTGNERTGVFGPGDTFEIDAYETNIAVMMPDGKGGGYSLGRAVLYLIIDVYTWVIAGFYIGLENNSLIGLTNAIYNLAEDKEEVLRKNGLENQIDPANFIKGVKPISFRVDNGSEFISNEFRRISHDLGIEIVTVPPGTGSMKSTVEHTFCRLQDHYEISCYKKGTITTEHGSRHHAVTPLTLEDARRILLIEISRHNSTLISTRSPDKAMVDAGVPAVPIKMWNFYMTIKPAARSLPEGNSLIYILSTPEKGKISRDRAGIEYKGLFYSYTDPECFIQELVDRAREADRTVDRVEIRIDPRSVDFIYYLDKSHFLHKLPINEKHDISVSYKGLSWKAYEDYRIKGKAQKAQEKDASLLLDLKYDSLVKSTVEAAASQHPKKNVTKNMRETRAQKKEEEKINCAFHLSLENGNSAPGTTFETSFEVKSSEDQESRDGGLYFQGIGITDYSIYNDLDI